MADLTPVREAWQASMTAWATLEIRADQAHVISTPNLEVLSMHLERIDPHWHIAWACDHVEPMVVRACLHVLGVQREGLASAHSLEDAKKLALAEVAKQYGLTLPTEGHWVEYSVEDGPNIADLEAEADPPPMPQTVNLPPELPKDPKMETAKRHIDHLIDELKAAGKGLEANKITIVKGYGETVEESREIYKELQALLKNTES